ncbi:MAG: nitrous oxide reductase accessory protein NosL [Bacteroidia bacterium]|nr:nitrous oxide reductase accessory protein NosL [Bacteroidia bacterium]MBT8278520.1 nitrous oxide reductase accessory protein NosL [Bacteroidia bacterium]NND26271.1 hypothetical protein [Flavobacteriaceae bacterium]NNK61221.1 hypothetical protein [Flavobacteriaceae bacterium]RZW54248.1 MAG: hypothetical protein EX263_05705 [Flavobacteriaceae bacterium]
MKTLKHMSLFIIALFLLGCSAKPEPIDYGNDGCYFCKMTIVDKIHGAELVTIKGKVYKYDAAECLVQMLNEFDPNDIGLLLTNHYNQPEELIDATKAIYLISKNIPSPMGANLSAFSELKYAQEVQAEKGGDIYSFEELKIHLNKTGYVQY